MDLITKETVENLIEAYEEQITELKNEVEALKASQSAETQSNERKQEAGVNKHSDWLDMTHNVFKDAKITGL